MKTYMLIRVAVDVGMEEWFGVKLIQSPTDSVAVDTNLSSDVPGISAVSDASTVSGISNAPDALKIWGSSFFGILRHPLQALRRLKKSHVETRQENESRRREEEERAQSLMWMETRLLTVESAIQRLSHEVQEMLEDTHDCFCVYEDSVRKALVGEVCVSREEVFWEQTEQQETRQPGLVSLWQKYFPWEEFNGYFQQFWVEQLLSEAIQPHFIILGPAPCLFPLLEKSARRMKSLRWVIPEVDCNQEFQDFVEDFYTEYGLAIALQTYADSAALKRMQLICEEPVNILDFTRETHLTVQQVAKGSIWLDMCSVEEKQRRILMRGDDITYLSLKGKWRKAQKRCNCPIFP